MMNAIDPGVLTQAWQEACRHVRSGGSTEEVARILADQTAAAALYVLEAEPASSTWDLRVGLPESDATPALRLGRPLRGPEARGLRRWLAAGELSVQRRGVEPRGPFAFLLLPPLAGEWLGAPLPVAEGQDGMVLLCVDAPGTIEPRHLNLLQALREPLAVALGNDRQLRQLDVLRAAAEEEKQAALRRIGRDHLVDGIVGAERGLRPVMERVRLVAGLDIPILLLGETGSGKEVIGRAIHEQSHRARGPFVRVNCAAISPELIDSELFGHERGAFTGATSARRGWFERADGGTLLLDEIGDLPPPAQVRLLRVLQEGMFERVGGEESVRVSVRIVAATHADLPGLVQKGRFREDLWYRISGFQIILPPLHERREDIPDLARHFLRRAAHRFGLRPLELSVEDLGLLASYDWPGNVRELASVIDRAAILGAGETLEVAKALGSGAALGPSGGPGRVAAPASLPPTGPLQTLDEAMRAHIAAALALTRGQIEGAQGAARVLAVNPHTLRARMRKLGIDWARYRIPSLPS